jgi:heme exporter protein C
MMPEPASPRIPKLLLALLGLSVLLLPIALYAIFVIAPVELQMGIVQKIFYIHMGSWAGMYIGFAMCSVTSALYLWKREDSWDALAVAGAEVGMVFCMAGLISGPLWARKAWGTFWTWDPRLTSTLLIAMVFFAYLVLRSFGATGEVEKRFAAGLAIIGLLDMPVIHYSVQKWRGTHPTVVTGKGGGLHPDMRPAFWISIVFVIVLSIALIWVRARAERVRQRLEALELEAAERGLLEEA